MDHTLRAIPLDPIPLPTRVILRASICSCIWMVSLSCHYGGLGDSQQ